MATEQPQFIDNTVISLPQAPSRKASEYLDSFGSWVYAATTYSANIFSSIEINLYKKKLVTKNGVTTIEYDEIMDHEALSLLQYVNPFMTQTMLSSITSIYQDLLGEAAWVLIRSGNPTTGQIEEIWPLRPDWIEIIPSRKNFIEKYVYKPGGGFKSVDIDPANLIWFKDLSPTNPYRGYGRVRAGAMAIDIDNYMSQWSRNFFFNSGIPSVVFKTTRSMAPDVAARYMEQFRTNFVGKQNSHKIALLEGGDWDVQELGGEAREMDFLESKKYIRDEILAMFGVSKANLGIVEDVNRSNQEASDARFMKNVIKPRLTSYVGILNEFFLPNWNDTNLFFNFVDPVPEDVELKLKKTETLVRSYVISVNEAREDWGLPPVEGGDIIYMPMGMAPLGESGEPVAPDGKAYKALDYTKYKTAKTPRVKFGAPIPVRSLQEMRKEQKAQEIKKQIMPELKELVSEIMRNADNTVEKYYTEEKKETFWKDLIKETDVQEDRMKILIHDLGTSQSKMVLDKLAGFNKHYSVLKEQTASSLLFDMKKENIRWERIIRPFIAKIVQDRGDDVLTEFGVATGLDMDNRNVDKYLESYIKMMVRELNKTTKKELVKSLAEGLRKGESIDKMRDRIIAVYEHLDKARATNIARTEVLRANNFANVEGYKQSGVVVKKQWLTAKDEATCPFCNSMNGKIIRVNDNFFDRDQSMKVTEDGKIEKIDFDYAAVGHPPLHPQCRCTILPITISQDRGSAIPETKDKVNIDKLAQDILDSIKEDSTKVKNKAVQSGKTI